MATTSRIDWDLVRNIAYVFSLIALGIAVWVGTQDRYYAEDANNELEKRDIRIQFIERELQRLDDRLNKHLDTHPDRGLQLQIHELREEQARHEHPR